MGRQRYDRRLPFFSSRGSNLDATDYDRNGIKLLQDGLPVTAADGNNHNRDVDPLCARYTIVARGANALTYGASTLGGAIDFISPTARDGAPNELLLNGGSHRPAAGARHLGTVAGAFDGLVTVEGKRSDGYREHQQAGAQRRVRQRRLAVRRRPCHPLLRHRHRQRRRNCPAALTRDECRADPRQGRAAALAGDYQVQTSKPGAWRTRPPGTSTPSSSLTAGVSYEGQQLYHPIVYAPPFFSLLIDTEQRNGRTLRYQRRMAAHDLLSGLNYGRTRVKGGNYELRPAAHAALSPRSTTDADSLELFAMDRWQFAPHWTAVYGGQAVGSRRDATRRRASTGDYRSIQSARGRDLPDATPTAVVRQRQPHRMKRRPLYRAERRRRRRARARPCTRVRGTVVEVGTRGGRPAHGTGTSPLLLGR